ncbi:UNVERIFIED_ORG: hypothetical protein QE446_004645 [Rhizobium sp. SORGH_AS260]|nr:hypothetical protein [Agrobacterium sp. RC10-4-1]MDP9735014.1 hypothetical protein [Rhizobium sp. SORGH_AS_0285]MDP9756721.1 hypothetical protein [Rhizobium sp. SORGH_AS_0260]MDR6084029.1 hypothetical protein [Agrobacterium sp. SORGH_AS_0440]
MHGDFNLTDLADVDRDVCEDMVTVFTFLARRGSCLPRGLQTGDHSNHSPLAAGRRDRLMSKPRNQASLSNSERRAVELDTIASVLPIERRDELAELLTDQDVETLKHLVNQGMGDNTLRALTSDLAYIEAWGLAATKKSLPWPAPEALLLKFVAHHLWDPEKRASDPDHGMPDDVEANLRRQGFLKSIGPHAPDTLRRQLAGWSTMTQWRGLSGPFSSPSLKQVIRLAVRAVPRKRRR